MKFIKTNMIGILICLFEIAVGVLLMVNPVGFTSGIIVIAGIVLIVAGVISIIKYFRSDAVKAAVGQMLGKGLATLLFGAFCTAASEWFIATFPMLTLLYGIVILIVGLYKVQWAVDSLRLKKGKWYLQAISALLSIAFGCVIIENPFTSTVVLWNFTGITLIIESVFDLIALFLSNMNHASDAGSSRTDQ